MFVTPKWKIQLMAWVLWSWDEKAIWPWYGSLDPDQFVYLDSEFWGPGHCEDRELTQKTQLCFQFCTSSFKNRQQNKTWENAKLELFAILWKIILLWLILWHVQLLRKPYLMVVLFFRSYCDLYVALLESLVVRVLCVLFLNIYYFQHAFNLSTKRKKDSVWRLLIFFLGIIYIILTLY